MRRVGAAWVKALVLLVVLAGAFALALPGLLSPTCRGSPERTAATALKTLTTAQADFRANDRDNNKVNDFWVRDVAGLYTLTPAGSEEPLKLIELSVAGADDAPSPETARARGEVAEPAPKFGYLYRALLLYEDEKGRRTPYDEGQGRNTSKFGFIAYPVGEHAERQPTFLINEENSVWKKHLKGGRVDTCPYDFAKAGWSKLDD